VLLRYFPSDCEMVPVAPVITGIAFAFTFHMRRISFIRSFYLKIFSASILITYVCLSAKIATSINIHVLFFFFFSKSRIMISGLLLGIVLFVCSCWFHNVFNYLYDLFRLILIYGHISVHCLILPLFSCVF
jgi:hypothetical protein